MRKGGEGGREVRAGVRERRQDGRRKEAGREGRKGMGREGRKE